MRETNLLERPDTLLRELLLEQRSELLYVLVQKEPLRRVARMSFGHAPTDTTAGRFPRRERSRCRFMAGRREWQGRLDAAFRPPVPLKTLDHRHHAVFTCVLSKSPGDRVEVGAVVDERPTCDQLFGLAVG